MSIPVWWNQAVPDQKLSVTYELAHRNFSRGLASRELDINLAWDQKANKKQARAGYPSRNPATNKTRDLLWQFCPMRLSSIRALQNIGIGWHCTLCKVGWRSAGGIQNQSVGISAIGMVRTESCRSYFDTKAHPQENKDSAIVFIR